MKSLVIAGARRTDGLRRRIVRLEKDIAQAAIEKPHRVEALSGALIQSARDLKKAALDYFTAEARFYAFRDALLEIDHSKATEINVQVNEITRAMTVAEARDFQDEVRRVASKDIEHLKAGKGRAKPISPFDQSALPQSGFLRQSQILGGVVPVGSSTLWRWVAAGTFPKPVKLSPRVTAWRVEDIQSWLKAQN